MYGGQSDLDDWNDDSPRKRMVRNRSKRARESSDGISFMTDSEQETLYTAVLSSKAPMQDLATGWIERYQVNQMSCAPKVLHVQ